MNAKFEELARWYLTEHREVRADWRPIASRLWGDRLDLMCVRPDGHEVWATIRPGQIAVGIGPEHADFEDFGRGMSEEQLGEEAFAEFRDLIEGRGPRGAAAAAADRRRP